MGTTTSPIPFPADDGMIRVRGARENNLRSIDVDIPRGRLVAFTGVSGSGKSSLAFGTIYAEAQRRFFESVAPYARRLIDQVGVPDVEAIEQLPPAVALQQTRTGGSSRSSVGSATTISNVLRMLYSRAGTYPEGADMLLAEDFSANTVQGACRSCHGIGRVYDVPEELMVPDPSLTIRERAIEAWPKAWLGTQMRDSLVSLGYDVDTPWKDLPREDREWILYTEETPKVPVYAKRSVEAARRALADGEKPTYTSTFVGVRKHVLDTFASSSSRRSRERAGAFLRSVECADCGGVGIIPEALAVRFEGLHIAQMSALPLREVERIMTGVLEDGWGAQMPPQRRLAARRLAEDLVARLGALTGLGLGYLSLDRSAPTLSAGELQRLRLATQVLSQLYGVVFVLDEPSAGLHPADTEALLGILRTLRDSGNSVLFVEHSPRVIREAEWIVDIGPDAGVDGGTVLHSGPVDQLRDVDASATRRYLFPDGSDGSEARGDAPAPRSPRSSSQTIELTGVGRNTVEDLDASFPIGALTAVTGMSGSGKSTLVSQALPELLARALDTQVAEDEGETGEGDPLLATPTQRTRGTAEAPAARLRRVIRVDQKPIGRTGRSNVATYTGLFDRVRALFARTPEARRRRYGAGRFSFNQPAGRCPECRGEGQVEVELLFLPTVHAPCSACGGARYNPETLEITLEGRTIADVLALSVDEAAELFDDATLRRYLRALQEVGLGYVSLGQPAPELSGGEAQRVKLASELHRENSGDTLYLLDEPTSGLHPQDADRLMGHLQSLVDGGSTVILVEHDMRIVAQADWVIDMGPGAGDEGGRIVAAGTPEQVAQAGTTTAPYLAAALG